MEGQETIRALLEQGHSTILRDELIEFVGNNPKRMAALMHFFFHDNKRYNQRAAWPLGHIGVSNPQLIEPYLKRLVGVLSNAKHDAVKRNTLRIFQDIEIPEEIQGDLYDDSIKLFCDLKQAAAVRIFAMSVMANIAEPYKELQLEVVGLIEEFMPFATAGYKSRAKKILKKFS